MTINDRPSILRERFEASASDHFDVLEHDLTFESGAVDDYHALASFHYRSHHPGVVSAVFRVVHEQPTVVGRYLQRRNDRIVVGVLVRSLPRLSCRLRDLALCNRYSTLPASDAALLVNRELRIISRVVIDPRWRGRGLAVRLVRHALGTPETIFTEALATMGRVHPFFERAGMIAYDQPPHEAHARLADALARVGLEPMHLASLEYIRGKLAALPQMEMRWFERELRRWQQTMCPSICRGMRRPSFEELAAAARQRLVARPMYYLYDHRAPPAPGVKPLKQSAPAGPLHRRPATGIPGLSAPLMRTPLLPADPLTTDH